MRRRSTHRVTATLEYLIAPEVEARFIRFTSQEIEIVLTDEVLRRVEWIYQICR